VSGPLSCLSQFALFAGPFEHPSGDVRLPPA